jgi:cell wall-associated NlpC family hydrolase
MASPKKLKTITGTEFLTTAAQYIGTPYVWGGESPKGFDCSGLVDYVLTDLGITGVPRTSEEQWKWVKKVNYKSLQPGDLIFLNFPGEQSPGHVMIYAGNNEVIQAPKPGQDVQVASFTPQAPGSTEWGATVVGYGRPPGVTTSPGSVSIAGGQTSGGGSSSLASLGTGCVVPALLMLSGLTYLIYYLS